MARQLWPLLSPLHTELTEKDPMYAHVDPALAHKESIEGPCSGSIN
jgi:hypothetical protein